MNVKKSNIVSWVGSVSESLVFLPVIPGIAPNSWLATTKHCQCWWPKTVILLVRWLMCNYCHRGGYVTAGVRLLVCQILMEFSGNVANGLRKSDLNFCDVLGTESDIWSPKDQSRGAFITKKPYGSCYTTAVCLNMWGNYLLSGGLCSLVFLF